MESLNNKKVLLVDDNFVNLIVAKNVLQRAGIRVTTAENGAAAIEQLNKDSFDAVLMDIQMPVMDGIELVKNLRTLPDYKFTPILMLTTESAGDKKMQGKSAGATGWLVKPFNPEQLLATIRKVLS